MTEPKKRSIWPKLLGCGCVTLVLIGVGGGVLACAGVGLGGGAAAGLAALIVSSDADLEPPDKDIGAQDPTLDIEPDALNPEPDAPVVSTPSEPTVSSSAAISAPADPVPAAPEPAPPADDEQNLDDEPTAATKTAHVGLEGGGRVVLIGGGKRYTLPADVPTGRYDIEATFPPDPPVNVGKITVNASGATVSCNEAMGMCRGS